MSPSETLRQILQRLEEEDWDGAVSLHAAEFIEAEVDWILESVRPRRPLPTVEGLMASDPQMPRSVAEYEVDRARREPPPNPFYGDLFGIEGAEDLEGMSKAEVFARYLHGRDFRWRWRDHLTALMARHPEHRDALEDQLARSASPWQARIIGQIVDGNRAYVLFGGETPPPEAQPMDHPPRVAVLRLAPEGWRLSSDIVPGYSLALGAVRVPDGEGGWVALT